MELFRYNLESDCIVILKCNCSNGINDMSRIYLKGFKPAC
jgi:hypothetical protein